MISEGKVRVVLSGNIPINQGVTDWIASHQTEFRNDGSYLSFTVEKGQEHTVNELAELIESIVAPGESTMILGATSMFVLGQLNHFVGL